MIRRTILLPAIILTMLFLTGFCAAGKEQTDDNQSKQPERSVAVDAFLVQMRTSALYEAGVSPLPDPDAKEVTVPLLLSLLLDDPNNGGVITSFSGTVLEGRRLSGEINASKTVRGRAEPPTNGRRPPRRHSNNYHNSTEYQIESRIKDDNTVALYPHLTYSGLPFDWAERMDEEKAMEPLSYSLTSGFTLQEGSVAIVDVKQNIDTKLFLIMRAQIKQ